MGRNTKQAAIVTRESILDIGEQLFFSTRLAQGDDCSFNYETLEVRP